MKIITLAQLITLLRAAYVSACEGLKLANKLGSKAHKSRCMAQLNRIRGELRKYEKEGDLFTCIAYRGCIVSII